MPKSTCSFDPCERDAATRGFCPGHYQQRRQGKDLRPLRAKAKAPRRSPNGTPLAVRLASSIAENPKTGCWEWTAHKHISGYGAIRVGGKTLKPHRLAYELECGPIPDDMVVDHLCRVRSCINPRHLRLVTSKQNAEHVSLEKNSNSSGYRGVSRKINRTGVEVWSARVTHNGKTYVLGSYATREEAADVARLKRLELFTHSDVDRTWDISRA